MTELSEKDQRFLNLTKGYSSEYGDVVEVRFVEELLIQKDNEHKAEIEKLKANELKSDLLAMCNARRLIKANKRTSNGRLASELFGMGCGSGRDYCRKLGLNPDSNETNYNKSVNQIKEQK